VPGLRDLVVQGAEHLMLTNVRHQYTFTPRHFGELVYHTLRQHPVLVHRAVQRELFTPLRYLPVPVGLHPRLNLLQQPSQRLAAVTYDRHIHVNGLVDLSGIDIDMNHFRFLGKGRQLAGHPVIEPRPDGDQKVALVDSVVRIGGAVHSQHPQRVRMRLRNRALAKQSARHQYVCFLRQRDQFVGRPRGHHPAPHIQDGSLGLGDEIGGCLDLGIVNDLLR